MLQVHISEKHQGQWGERLCLPWNLHDDWCKPRRCSAGETLFFLDCHFTFTDFHLNDIHLPPLSLLFPGLHLLLWCCGLLGEPQRWLERHVLQGERLTEWHWFIRDENKIRLICRFLCFHDLSHQKAEFSIVDHPLFIVCSPLLCESVGGVETSGQTERAWNSFLGSSKTSI